MKQRKPIVVAEIGCNHQGSLELAIEMIHKAAQCGASVVKFQKREPSLMPKRKALLPHPHPEHAFGRTYGKHRQTLEFTSDEHEMLKGSCEQAGVQYACSVFDIPSAEEIIAINPAYIKLGSGQTADFQLMEYVKKNWNGPIHVSLGMTTKEEREELYEYWGIYKPGVVLYHCTSGYPIEPKDACLLELDELLNVCYPIGYSGHHMGTYLDIAAFALGATYIERHFTLDRTMKGSDQAMSLEPAEMAELVAELNEVSEALQYRPRGILPIEKEVRKRHRYNVSRVES